MITVIRKENIMSTDNFERKIENVVNKIENSANDAWKKRSFRILSKSVSALIEVGMMIGFAFSVIWKWNPKSSILLTSPSRSG